MQCCWQENTYALFIPLTHTVLCKLSIQTLANQLSEAHLHYGIPLCALNIETGCVWLWQHMLARVVYNATTNIMLLFYSLLWWLFDMRTATTAFAAAAVRDCESNSKHRLGHILFCCSSKTTFAYGTQAETFVSAYLCVCVFVCVLSNQ